MNAVKGFSDLDKKTRTVSLARFIAGFDIDGIGVEIAQSLITAGVTFDTLFNLTVEDLVAIPGWGSTRSVVFLNGLKKNEKDMRELAKILKIQEPVTSESSSITGMHICVTGKLEKLSRKDVEKLVKSKGANFDASVTSNTDILVTNDTTSGSSKLNNARKYGTKIVSEEEFYELLNS